MRRRLYLADLALVIVATVVAGTLPGQAAGAQVGRPALTRSAAIAGAWRNAFAIPGLSALNTGGAVKVNSLSCGSVGNCAVGGSYRTRSGIQQAFVASEVAGSWGLAAAVPGIATLNVGRHAEVVSVSCARAGGCAAGGYYTDSASDEQAFVVGETGDSWGQATEVPGLAALNVGGLAQVSSMSCPSPGQCAAGGFYNDLNSYTQAFVVSEQNGTWATAIQIPFAGTAYYPEGLGAISALSCSRAGNCAAGGYDSGKQPSFYKTSAFVVNEKNGHWGKVLQVPGLAALNHQSPHLDALSCSSVGNCAAGGDYVDRSAHYQPFVVSDHNGTWGKAIEVPGSAAFNSARIAPVSSVSCASAGNCVAGGFKTGSNAGRIEVRGFVVSEKSGKWGAAIAEPGAALFGGRNATVTSVSCATPGNCAAGGGSKDSSFRSRAFVLSERDGTWGTAIEVPGLATLSAAGPATVKVVACPRRGECTAVGTYRDSTGAVQAFIVTQSG